MHRPSSPLGCIRPGQTIVFQGDSITDCGRDRSVEEPNDAAGMGGGYAGLAAAWLLARFGPKPSAPGGGVACFNRGVGGNKAFDLANRWHVDCLRLKPDVVSVFVGINDTWHSLRGFEALPEATLPRFAHHIETLLSGVREQNPQACLVLCDPFVVPAGDGARLDFEPELSERRRLLGEAAERHGAVRVRFQDVMNEKLASGTLAIDLAEDGVHPTLFGHALLAEAWLAAVAGASPGPQPG